MDQRHVTEAEVQETLSDPDIPYFPGEEGDEEIAVKQFGDRQIKVIFEETKRDIIVIYTVIAKPLKELREPQPRRLRTRKRR